MVNMNSSKFARQQDSIKNLPTCGGSKKSGLMRFIGMDSSISFSRFGIKSDTRPVYGMNCPGNFSVKRNQTCAGGVGKHVTMRHCGTGDSTNETVMKETKGMQLPMDKILSEMKDEEGFLGNLIGKRLLPEVVTEEDINDVQQYIENSSYICSSPLVNKNGYLVIGNREIEAIEDLKVSDSALVKETDYVSIIPTFNRPGWICMDSVVEMEMVKGRCEIHTYNPFAQFYLPGIYFIPNGNHLTPRALLFLTQNLVDFCNLEHDDLSGRLYVQGVDADRAVDVVYDGNDLQFEPVVYTSGLIHLSNALTEQQYDNVWNSMVSGGEPLKQYANTNQLFINLVELMAIAHSIPIYIGDGDGDGDEYISAWMLTGGTRAFCRSLYGTDSIIAYSKYIIGLLNFLLTRDEGLPVGDTQHTYEPLSYQATDKIKFTLDLDCLQNHLFEVTTDTSSFLTKGGIATSKNISNYYHFGWDPIYNNTLNLDQDCITTSVSTNESEKTLLFSTIKTFRESLQTITSTVLDVELTGWDRVEPGKLKEELEADVNVDETATATATVAATLEQTTGDNVGALVDVNVDETATVAATLEQTTGDNVGALVDVNVDETATADPNNATASDATTSSLDATTGNAAEPTTSYAAITGVYGIDAYSSGQTAAPF